MQPPPAPCRSPFGKTVFGVTIAHGITLVLVIVCGAWQGCRLQREPITLPIEFMVEVPESAAPDEVQPPREDPAPEPEQDLPKPDDILVPDKQPDPPKAPAEKPKPQEQKPPKKREIQVNRTRVYRNLSAQGTTSSKPRMSDAEIQRLLDLGATPGDRTVVPEGDALHLEVIRRTMYRVWVQPGAIPPNLTAEAAIDLTPSGQIAGRRLLRGSGNTQMDQSIRRALDAVDRIDGLPSSFITRHRTVTITFELTQRSG